MLEFVEHILFYYSKQKVFEIGLIVGFYWDENIFVVNTSAKKHAVPLMVQIILKGYKCMWIIQIQGIRY